MAGKWAEGFETHSNASQLARKYAEVQGSISVQAGRVFGSSGAIVSTVLVTPSLGLADTYILGFGMRLTQQIIGLNSGAQGFYFEKGNDEQCHLEIVSNSGSFELRLMRGGTQLAITTEAFAHAVWHYFELEVTIHPSTGAYELRHNETPVISGSGVNTADDASSQADVFAFRFTSNTTPFLLFDDLYLVDTTGSTNNDFLGDSVVEGCLPNGAGASTQWTNDAGSGSNWENVDDSATAAPVDTGVGGRNSSDTNGQIDLYAFQDLTQIDGNIHFVQVGVQLAMAATGSRQVRTKYRDPDTTVANGTTHTVDNTAYDEFTEIMDVNPASAAAWDVDDINNGQFGVEVVS